MGVLAAGRLNKRILIQYKASVQNAGGQQSETWVDLVTVWADIRFQSGMSAVNHQFQAGGVEVSVSNCSMRIRKRSDIDATMRVVYKARYYDISDVLPDEAGNEFLDIVCKVGGNRG